MHMKYNVDCEYRQTPTYVCCVLETHSWHVKCEVGEPVLIVDFTPHLGCAAVAVRALQVRKQSHEMTGDVNQ